MQAPNPSKGKFTVALWHAPDQPAPERLRTALHGKGVETVDVTSSYAALAEACARRNGPSAADDKGRGSGIVIIFPEHLADAPALLDAVWRYAPGTRCWNYGPLASPRLTPVVEPAASQETDPSESAPRRPQAAQMPAVEPKLKLTEPGPVSTPSDTSDHEEGTRLRGPLLSAEELSMLLADDAEEGSA